MTFRIKLEPIIKTALDITSRLNHYSQLSDKILSDMKMIAKELIGYGLTVVVYHDGSIEYKGKVLKKFEAIVYSRIAVLDNKCHEFLFAEKKKKSYRILADKHAMKANTLMNFILTEFENNHKTLPKELTGEIYTQLKVINHYVNTAFWDELRYISGVLLPKFSRTIKKVIAYLDATT